MNLTFAETFKGGQILSDVESVTLVNATQKIINKTVPDDTVYEIIGIKVTNPDNVARDLYIKVFKTSSKSIEVMTIGFKSGLGASAQYQVPNMTVSDTAFYNWMNGLILGAGNTIEVKWNSGGASAGGTDADGLVFHYRKLSKT